VAVAVVDVLIGGRLAGRPPSRGPPLTRNREASFDASMTAAAVSLLPPWSARRRVAVVGALRCLVTASLAGRGVFVRVLGVQTPEPSALAARPRCGSTTAGRADRR
jgi:hypothetical protein